MNIWKHTLLSALKRVWVSMCWLAWSSSELDRKFNPGISPSVFVGSVHQTLAYSHRPSILSFDCMLKSIFAVVKIVYSHDSKWIDWKMLEFWKWTLEIFLLFVCFVLKHGNSWLPTSPRPHQRRRVSCIDDRARTGFLCSFTSSIFDDCQYSQDWSGSAWHQYSLVLK